MNRRLHGNPTSRPKFESRFFPSNCRSQRLRTFKPEERWALHTKPRLQLRRQPTFIHLLYHSGRIIRADGRFRQSAGALHSRAVRRYRKPTTTYVDAQTLSHLVVKALARHHLFFRHLWDCPTVTVFLNNEINCQNQIYFMTPRLLGL
jgi:hypothetical protein